MNDYTSQMVNDVLTSLDSSQLEDVETKDFRGVLEIEVKDPQTFLAVVSEIETRGWVPSNFRDVARSRVGVSFDTPDPIRATIDQEAMRKWASCFEERPLFADILHIIDVMFTPEPTSASRMQDLLFLAAR